MQNELVNDDGNFCQYCGSIFASASGKKITSITCDICKKKGDMKTFLGITTTQVITFDPIANKASSGDDIDESNYIEHLCKKCGNDEMKYKTIQTRSADEGQTVFYTCAKCNFKEVEYS
ncbi:hypothetical protein SNEBB_008631 [Seison nebaliae]|nr:hypothetical protein SNEBB_008631 [Seison nebaliae]